MSTQSQESNVLDYLYEHRGSYPKDKGDRFILKGALYREALNRIESRYREKGFSLEDGFIKSVINKANDEGRDAYHVALQVIRNLPRRTANILKRAKVDSVFRRKLISHLRNRKILKRADYSNQLFKRLQKSFEEILSIESQIESPRQKREISDFLEKIEVQTLHFLREIRNFV